MAAALSPEPEIWRLPSMLPSIKRSLEALPEISLQLLTEDHKSCNICMEQFTDERPVLLRCGHIFGSICIKAWASTSQVSQPTCPMCRTILTPPSSIERWEYFATIMLQQPYTSLCQNLRRSDTFPSEDRDSAVQLVSLFFQVVMEMLAHHRRHRIPASALLIQSAQAVACRMGCLYVLLKPMMDFEGVTVPWDERGPSVVTILDLKCERIFGEALEKMAQLEERVTAVDS